MPRIIIEGYHCNRCGRNWSPRTGTGYRDGEDPKYCGRCSSPYWNRPRKLTAYEQRPGVETRQPHIMIEGYHCDRCGFRWSTRDGTGKWADTDPKNCPKCRSRLWNRPKKRQLPAHRRAPERCPPGDK